MTLSQLRAFALVARLGSMRAAAETLGVSEPAVSAAIAALRQDLGDPLVVRAGGGIALTAGGRRLAAHADEIVGLAERARREVAAAATSKDVLRVGVTAAFEEYAAAGLVDAFTRRSRGTQVEVVAVRSEQLGTALVERSVDIALGVRPPEHGDVALDVVPLLRYQRIVVVGRGHRLAGCTGPVSRAELLRERWLAGPAGIEELSEEGRWLAERSLVPGLLCLPSEGDALLAVLDGDGLLLALRHAVRDELAANRLVRLPVTGTPVHGLWCAATLGRGRAGPSAVSLQRFATTPDATAAMVALSGAPRAARRLPPVHVNLWS